MRTKKLRGHKRRWKQIEKWRKESLSFSKPYFEEYKRDYKEILIHPWSSLNTIHSVYPQPNGKTKQKIIEGLIEVFNHWKSELIKSNQDFSLYFWLYEERFHKSQIVCATEDFIDYYDTTFKPALNVSKIFSRDYPNLKQRIHEVEWNLFYDEDYYDQSYLGNIVEYPNLQEYNRQEKWFSKLKKRKHRNIASVHTAGMFTLKEGTVWIGKYSHFV